MGQEFLLQPMQGEIQTALEAMPPAWYRAVVTEAEIKETNDKTGIGLNLCFKIIDGPFKDRTHYEWYNRRNASQQSVDIATKQLNTLAGCMGLWGGVQNTDQLMNIPVQIKLGYRKDNPDQNAVKGYRDINGNDPVKPGTAVAGVAPVAQLAQTAPATPVAPATPAAPAAPIAHNPQAAAAADGWMQHPQDGRYLYKGSDVKLIADVEAMYPAPPPPVAAAPAAPAVPAAPAAPAAPGAPAYTPAAAYPPPVQPGAAPATAAYPAPPAQAGAWSPATPGAGAAWKP